MADGNSDLSKALGKPVKNIDDLRAGLIRLEKEGIDLQKALELTDKRSVSAFMSIMKGAGDLDSLRDSITNVTDEFQQMSATMGDNVAGAMAGLKSAAEELVLKISSGTNGPIKELIKALTSLVQWLGEVIEFIGKYNRYITPVIAAFVSYKLAVVLATAATKLYGATVRGLRALLAASKVAILLCSTAFKTMGGNVVAATKSVTALKAAMASTPWTAVIGAITALGVAIYAWCQSNNEVTESIKRVNEAEKTATERYAEQKSVLDSLIFTARNENIAMAERLNAVNKLNEIIPGYNANIDKTTGKYRASTKALNQYLDSLKKKLLYEANMEELSKLTAENARLRREAVDVNKAAAAERKINENSTGVYVQSEASSFAAAPSIVRNEKQRQADAINRKLKQSDTDINNLMAHIDYGVKKGLMAPQTLTKEDSEEVNSFTENMNQASSAAHSVVDEVKDLRKELKELRKLDPQTDAEFKDIEDRKAKIQKRLRTLTGKDSKNKNRHTTGTYAEDSLDEATAAADDTHQKKMLEINKEKGKIPEADFIIKKNEELIRYCGDLEIALQSLREKTSSTHTATLDKITEEENKIGIQLVAAQQAINKATAQKEMEGHEQRLAAQQAFYDTQEQTVRQALIEQEKTEGEAEVYLLAQKKGLHESQLKELQDFYKKTENADYLGEEEKRLLLDKLAADIRSMQSQVLTDTGKFSETLREAMTDTTSAEGIANSFQRQIDGLAAYYESLKSAKNVSAEEIVALEEEKQRRIAALRYQALEQQWQLQELTGLSWGQEYQRELAQLENYHRQGLIKEKDYQRKKLQLGVNNAKKYFDYYAQLSGSMFTAIQDAEIAKSDAKYDVLIQQAKNNGEDTAALEEEKENKKLEIQKKYADVNFAIKVSQIIADTAVGVIKTFAQLGYTPWGIAAAALMTATGVAQMATAKAERDKIKNMQPGNTAGATTQAPAKAERVLSGYADGGYTGDGDRYEVAGVVHRGEYVVPKPIMDNPRVVDAVGTIEAIRRNKILGAEIPVGTPSAGYADGGYTSAAPAVDTSDLTAAAKELREAAKNIRAYVVLRDIDDSRDALDRARAPFTRKK